MGANLEQSSIQRNHEHGRLTACVEAVMGVWFSEIC